MNNVAFVPFFFISMLPLMLILAIPIASLMATYLIIHTSSFYNELLFILYNKKAHKALLKSTVLFSFVLASLYIPLLFQWAPQSYHHGKKLLISSAKKNLFNLKKEILHNTIPNIAIYFKDKQKLLTKTYFNNLFMSFKDKNNEKYYFCSQKGFLEKNKLTLYNGSSFYITKAQQQLYSSFKQTTIHLDRLLPNTTNKSSNGLNQPKFLTWNKLHKQKEAKFYIEKHKRIAQIVWLFLFPLLAFLCSFIDVRYGKKTSVAKGIILTGILFLIMYASLTLGQVSYFGFCTSITIIYSTIILVSSSIITLYIISRL